MRKILGEYDEVNLFFQNFITSKLQLVLVYFLKILFWYWTKNFKNVVLTGWHPHNYSFQILAEIGIFGFIIFLSKFFFLILKFFKNFFNFKDRDKINELNLYLLAGFVLNMFPIPSGDFFNNWVNILIYLPVGYYLFLNEK